MPVYLFHGLIYSALKTTPVLKNIDTLPEIFLLLSACILLSFALASKPFNWFVDKISSLPVKKTTPVLKNIDTLPEIFLLLSACILLSFALASKPFNWFVDKISSLPVKLPNPVSGMRFPPVPTFLGRRHQAQ